MLGSEPHAQGVDVRMADLLRLRGPARQMILANSTRSRGHMAGIYASAFRGRGIDFDEVRPYQPGDDIRTMDWRVTARTGRPHTKLFHEERERPVFLLVDQGPTMAFGTRRAFKRVAAAEAASLLAWAALAHGDRVGALVYSGQAHRELRPMRGERGVVRVLQALSRPVPPGIEAADMVAPLRRLRHVARPGSLMFVIGDFRGWNAPTEQLLGCLAKHNKLVLIFVFDPMERELPSLGRLPVTDGQHRLTVDAGHRALGHSFRAAFDQRRKTIEDFCRGRGIRYLALATDADPLQVLRPGTGLDQR